MSAAAKSPSAHPEPTGKNGSFLGEMQAQLPQNMLIHPVPTTPLKAESIEDFEFSQKGNSPLTPDRTPGKYEAVKSMISRYRSAPRALYQRELVKNGISEEAAKKYGDMLEERGMDTEEKVNMMLRRVRRRFPKLS